MEEQKQTEGNRRGELPCQLRKSRDASEPEDRAAYKWVAQYLIDGWESSSSLPGISLYIYTKGYWTVGRLSTVDAIDSIRSYLMNHNHSRTRYSSDIPRTKPSMDGRDVNIITKKTIAYAGCLFFFLHRWWAKEIRWSKLDNINNQLIQIKTTNIINWNETGSAENFEAQTDTLSAARLNLALQFKVRYMTCHAAIVNVFQLKRTHNNLCNDDCMTLTKLSLSQSNQ